MWLLLLGFVVTIPIAASQSSNCPNRQSIEQSLAKVHVPGAAIVVVNATHILYEQAFGYQSLAPAQPINIDKSIFPIASISKTFIATAVMQLVEGELADLDTDINQYLSELDKRIFHPRYPSHSITLRKLLSHSASIAVSPQIQNTYYRPGDIAFVESLADMVFTYVNPNTSHWLPKPPGSVTSYSNEGAALAALVVERIAKISYIEYVKEKILRPLGVNISNVGVRLADFASTEDFVEHYAYAFNASYLEGWKQVIPQLNITQISDNLPTWLHFEHFGFSAYPSGLLRMSARTLSVYLRMFLNNGFPILRPRSIAEMRTIVGGGLIPPYNQDWSVNSTGRRPPSQFGLSWYWETASDSSRYIGHSGSLPGMVHLMLVNENNNLGVIFLSNGDVSAPTDLTREITQTMENIHMSLFRCFETPTSTSTQMSTPTLTQTSTSMSILHTSPLNGSVFRTKASFLGIFYAILLCFHS